MLEESRKFYFEFSSAAEGGILSKKLTEAISKAFMRSFGIPSLMARKEKEQDGGLSGVSFKAKATNPVTYDTVRRACSGIKELMRNMRDEVLKIQHDFSDLDIAVTKNDEDERFDIAVTFTPIAENEPSLN